MMHFSELQTSDLDELESLVKASVYVPYNGIFIVGSLAFGLDANDIDVSVRLDIPRKTAKTVFKDHRSAGKNFTWRGVTVQLWFTHTGENEKFNQGVPHFDLINRRMINEGQFTGTFVINGWADRNIYKPKEYIKLQKKELKNMVHIDEADNGVRVSGNFGQDNQLSSVVIKYDEPDFESTIDAMILEDKKFHQEFLDKHVANAQTTLADIVSRRITAGN